MIVDDCLAILCGFATVAFLALLALILSDTGARRDEDGEEEEEEGLDQNGSSASTFSKVPCGGTVLSICASVLIAAVGCVILLLLPAEILIRGPADRWQDAEGKWHPLPPSHRFNSNTFFFIFSFVLVALLCMVCTFAIAYYYSSRTLRLNGSAVALLSEEGGTQPHPLPPENGQEAGPYESELDGYLCPQGRRRQFVIAGATFLATIAVVGGFMLLYLCAGYSWPTPDAKHERFEWPPTESKRAPFKLFLVGVLCLLSWVLAVAVLGGIGVIALPVFLISYYKQRPRLMEAGQLARARDVLNQDIILVLAACHQVRDERCAATVAMTTAANRGDALAKEQARAQVARLNTKDALLCLEATQLEKEYAYLQACESVSPETRRTYCLVVLLATACCVLSLAWVVEILLYIIQRESHIGIDWILCTIFLSSFPLIPACVVHLMCLYLVACVAAGAHYVAKIVDKRTAIVGGAQDRSHLEKYVRLRVGATSAGVLLFNASLCGLASPAITQLAAFCFPLCTMYGFLPTVLTSNMVSLVGVGSTLRCGPVVLLSFVLAAFFHALV